MSIGNQREMLVCYCKDNCLPVVDIYIDDGFPGMNFERPEFQRMIRDIEDDKNVPTIIKSLKRVTNGETGEDLITKIQYAETNLIRYLLRAE